MWFFLQHAYLNLKPWMTQFIAGSLVQILIAGDMGKDCLPYSVTID